jgi:hypothetical protein
MGEPTNRPDESAAVMDDLLRVAALVVRRLAEAWGAETRSALISRYFLPVGADNQVSLG